VSNRLNFGGDAVRRRRSWLKSAGRTATAQASSNAARTETQCCSEKAGSSSGRGENGTANPVNFA
jgi:hypothetical protein